MKKESWIVQLQKTINSPDHLPDRIALNNLEKEYFKDNKKDVFGLRTTPYYLSLIDFDDPDDPVRKMIIPDAREHDIKSYEEIDPLSEQKYSPLPGLVHRYLDRVLVYVTSMCPVNCRYCFRRGFIRNKKYVITNSELAAICDYIKNNSSIAEVILSGGDPLLLSDDKIFLVLKKLRSIRPGLLIRIGTRMPVVLPQRITSELAARLKAMRPIWIATHFNHPAEITDESRRALTLFIEAGIPVLNQTVLLKKVNDNFDILEKLFRELVLIGVKPYYLLHGDLAAGTSHFRIPLSRSIALYRELGAKLSGILVPKLAMDLPGGGGKIPVDSCPQLVDNHYLFTGFDGKIYRYPLED